MCVCVCVCVRVSVDVDVRALHSKNQMFHTQANVSGRVWNSTVKRL